jgi:hypothetical protein
MAHSSTFGYDEFGKIYECVHKHLVVNATWNYGSLPEVETQVEVLLPDGSIVSGEIEIVCACGDVPESCLPVVISNHPIAEENGVVPDHLYAAWRFPSGAQ